VGLDNNLESSSPGSRVFLRELASMSIDFPKEEEAIIARWREIKAFERQVRIHFRHNLLMPCPRAHVLN
jgi:hypothetical protein